MKTKMKTTLALLALGASALAASAQDNSGSPPPNGPGPRGHHPPPLPLVMALDINHDGVIDSNEIANASAVLKTLDKNGDSQLTADEYLPLRPAQMGNFATSNHRPPPSPVINALDANHDGVISADEIANAPASLKTLDKSGDGQLTADEYLPPRPAQMGDANGKPHRPPPSPVIAALDANHDGVISADEIANALAALKTLDKNGDGQLTRDELRPLRPSQNGDAAAGDQPAPPDGVPAGPPPGE